MIRRAPFGDSFGVESTCCDPYSVMRQDCSKGDDRNETDHDPCHDGKNHSDEIGICDTPHTFQVILQKLQPGRPTPSLSLWAEAGEWSWQ